MTVGGREGDTVVVLGVLTRCFVILYVLTLTLYILYSVYIISTLVYIYCVYYIICTSAAVLYPCHLFTTTTTVLQARTALDWWRDMPTPWWRPSRPPRATASSSSGTRPTYIALIHSASIHSRVHIYIVHPYIVESIRIVYIMHRYTVLLLLPHHNYCINLPLL